MASSPLVKLVCFTLLTGWAAVALEANDQTACIVVSGTDVGVDSTSSSEIKVSATGPVTVKGELGFRRVPGGTGSAIEIPKQSSSTYSIETSSTEAKVCKDTRQTGDTGAPSRAPTGQATAIATSTNDPNSGGNNATSSGGSNPTSSGGSNFQPATNNAGSSKVPDCINSETRGANCDLNATITGLAAPETPAFTVLGITPKSVARPQSPSELAAALADGFDDRGNFQTGLAVDAVPFLWVAAHKFTLGKYNQAGIGPQLTRWGSRTSVSFATAKGIGDSDKSVRLGLGVRSVLWQKNDPRKVFYDCVSRLTPPGDPTRKFEPGDDLRFEAQVKGCETDSAKKVWNSSSFMIAAAPSWISIPNATATDSTGYRRNGGGYWSSFAWGFSEQSQVTFSAQRRTGEMIPDQTASGTSASGGATPNMNFISQSSTVFGGQYRYGTPGLNALFEGLSVHKKISGKVDDYAQYALGVEKQLADAFFLDLSYRWAPGTRLGTSGLLGSLNWSFNQKPQLAPQ